MVGKILLLCACICPHAFAAEEPLLSVEVYAAELGETLAGEVDLQVVSARSGEDYGPKMTGHQGRVPEGSYRLKASAPGFNSYEETIRVVAPNTVVRVGLSVGIQGDLAFGLSRPTSELISGYVDSELSKGRDLWVQVYPVFRPQEQGRVTRVGGSGHFEISVPVNIGPWLLVVIEMFRGTVGDLPKTERFPFPKVVGSRVVHASDMPVKVDLK